MARETREPADAADPCGGLTPAERAAVAEEEALLARVRLALAARGGARGDGDLVERLRTLRDEALESTAKDLPTVFQEMGVLRAVMERARPGDLPDPAAPYFAHLRVRDGDDERDYCLGRHTFVDREAGVRVVDWRWAPVAALFYRYREGEEFEEPFPGRVARGHVAVRRVVVVDRGRLVRIAADGFALSRGPGGAWRAARGPGAALGGGEGTAARAGALGTGAGGAGRAASPEITALLDPDQYAAVAAPADAPLLVLGSAGSGKTTVALHRLARIAFEDPRRFPASRLQVVVPELGLARLAARLLEPLGLDRAHVRTVEAWARGAFQSTFGAPPPRLAEETPPLVARLKRHPALFEALRRRPRLAGARPAFLALRRELGDLCGDRAFLEAVVAGAGGDLPTTAVAETLRHTRLQLAAPEDLSGVDPDRRETLDGRPIDEDTPEALSGTLDAEDLPLLLFLAARGAAPAGKRTAHLVVDEAEDVSLIELFVLGRQLAGRSVTVAGDESQQTFSSYAGWPEALRALGVERAATVRLETTYRCPRAVAELAHAVLGPLAPAAPPRAGKAGGAPVSRFDFPTEAHAHLFLAGAIRDLVEREPRASVAVIAHAPEVARSIHRLLADLPEARLALDGKFTFRPGVDLTDVASVKGLEFDYVVVPDASIRAYPDADEARRRLHVAVTRAAHQLWIAAPGTPSPLLAGLRPT